MQAVDSGVIGFEANSVFELLFARVCVVMCPIAVFSLLHLEVANEQWISMDSN